MKNCGLLSLMIFAIWLIMTLIIYLAMKTALTKQERNDCDMTYMFEHPEYIKVKLKEQTSKKFPRYGLYLYGEGYYAQEQRRSLQLHGIPVLFIPGNAGSYRQVRSLASVALRKAHGRRIHFNYFTVDLDEDLSGLYGGVLKQEVDFVYKCILHIAQMYRKSHSSPQSIILIGHSMGGMIARALFAMKHLPSKLVSVILTLGTPHKEPVLSLDSHLNSFYHIVNTFWESNTLLENVSIIALSGGSRDVLVPPKYCSLPTTLWKQESIVVTTALTNVWLTIDHLALCWCKQLVLVVNRALFSLIDEEIGGIYKDKSTQIKVLQKYFGGFENDNEVKGQKIVKSKIHSSLSLYMAARFVGRIQKLSLYDKIVIEVHPNISDKYLVVLSRSLANIFIGNCRSIKNNMCDEIEPVTSYTLPSVNKKAVFVAHLTKLVNTSHLTISSLQYPCKIFIQLQTTSNLKMIIGVSRFRSTDSFLNISLPMIRNNFDIYSIKVKKVNLPSDYDQSSLLLGRIHIPWSREDIYARELESMEFSLLLQLHRPKPAGNSHVVQLHVWKTDNCEIEVTVKYSFWKTIGRIMILYGPSIVQWMYSWFIFIVIYEQKELCVGDILLPLHSLIFTKKFLKFLPPMILLADGKRIQHLLVCIMELEDYHLMFYDWFLPTVTLLVISIILLSTMLAVLEVSLMILAKIVLIFIPLWKNAQTKLENGKISPVVFYTYIGIVLLFTMFSSPIALYLLTCVVFFLCCHMSIVIERNTLSKMERVDLQNSLNFGKTFLVILTVISVQMTPAFLVWLKVLSSSWFLPGDPFCPIVLLLLPSVVCLKEMRIVKPFSFSWFITLTIGYVSFYFLESLDKKPLVLGAILLIVELFIFETKNKEKEN